MPLSAREVDRLGERIKSSPLTEPDRRLLLEFRSSFLPAYQEVVTKIRDDFGFDPTGRPEKTPESIIAKLHRGETKLSRMQDIAGCRIIVEGRPLQNEVAGRLVQLFPDARVKDRREQPSFGYRAVHVIARAQGRQVEVQVRTSLQHAWANFVESLSDSMAVDLKHGVEAPEGQWLEWLIFGADCIDRLEQVDLGQVVGDMNHAELSAYRKGQFEGIMLLVPFIRELSR